MIFRIRAGIPFMRVGPFALYNRKQIGFAILKISRCILSGRVVTYSMHQLSNTRQREFLILTHVLIVTEISLMFLFAVSYYVCGLSFDAFFYFEGGDFFLF